MVAFDWASDAPAIRPVETTSAAAIAAALLSILDIGFLLCAVVGAQSRRAAGHCLGLKRRPGPYGLALPTAGRQTRRRRSLTVTLMSMITTKAASTTLPANPPATSNTPSACWI